MDKIFTINFATVTQKFPHAYLYRPAIREPFITYEFDPSLIKTPNIFNYYTYSVIWCAASKRQVQSTKDDLKYTRIIIDNNVNLKLIQTRPDYDLVNYDVQELYRLIYRKYIKDGLGLDETSYKNDEIYFFITKLIYDTTITDLMYLFGYKKEEEWNTGEQANIPHTIIDIKNVIEKKIINTNTYSQKVINWWKDHPFLNNYDKFLARQFNAFNPDILAGYYIHKYKYDFEILTHSEKKILQTDYTRHSNDVNPSVILRTMIYDEYINKIQDAIYYDDYTGIKIGLPTNFVDIADFIVDKILTSNRYDETTLDWWKRALDEIKNIGKSEIYLNNILKFLIN